MDDFETAPRELTAGPEPKDINEEINDELTEIRVDTLFRR